MSSVLIEQGDAGSPDVRELARQHREWASGHSPPEDVHAIDADGLGDPAITLLTARTPEGVLLGIGALRELDPQHGELKAMHVVPSSRGQQIGRSLLDALLSLAAQRGYRQVSLETGTMEAFASARALYASAGLTPCPPFAQYSPSPNSMYLTLALAEGSV